VFNELDNKDEADMLVLASFFQTLTGGLVRGFRFGFLILGCMFMYGSVGGS
jgi:hypothetical protein